MHPRSQVDRCVAEGLPADDELALRSHLRGCAECRAYYDAQRLLARALAGDVNQPTTVEVREHERRVVDALFPPTTPPPSRFALGALFDRLLWTPPRAFALAGAGVVGLLLLFLLVPTGGVAATVLHARGATVAGAPLKAGSEVGARAPIELGKDGAVELSLVRGGTLRIFGGARLALGARGASVALERGKVWALPDPGKGRFEVTTPTALVRVLGTSFIVDASAERTDVRVVTGSVEVIDNDERGRVTLGRGEGTLVKRGEPPQPAQRVSTAEDTNEWQRFFEQLLRHLQDGFESITRELQRGGAP